MAFQIGDRVLETTTTTGTGTITLAGAVTGYRAFSAVVTTNGDRFPYVIAGGTEWEVGYGTRTAATTFTRATADVVSSSNAGALVTFSAGTKEVWIDLPSQYLNVLGAIGADNLVINGAMEVSQENVGNAQAAAASGSYIVDMVRYINLSAAVCTIQQVADAPAGFSNSAKVVVTTADASIAATDATVIYTWIEGSNISRLNFGTANASSVSLGFWVKAHRTGTYTGSLRNGATNRSITFEYTVIAADTWEYKTVTLVGDTTGSWPLDSTAGIFIAFAMSLGSNFTQTAGSWQATGALGTANQVNSVGAVTDTFQITGVTFVAGSAPVPSHLASSMVSPFDIEKDRCSRYFQKSFNYATAVAGAVGVNTGEYSFSSVAAGAVAQRSASYPFREAMRNNPTITVYNPAINNSQVRDETTNTDCSASTAAGSATAFIVNTTTNAASIIGSVLGFHWKADARL